MSYETFYHVHRGFFPSKLEYDIDLEQGIFYSIKDFYWNKIEKDIGLTNGYGGFREYKIEIPSKSFTKSLEDNHKKILKITDENKKEFAKLCKKESRKYFHTRFAGVDATDYFGNEISSDYSKEGVIFRLDIIKPIITLVNIAVSHPKYIERMNINKIINKLPPKNNKGFESLFTDSDIPYSEEYITEIVMITNKVIEYL